MAEVLRILLQYFCEAFGEVALYASIHQLVIIFDMLLHESLVVLNQVVLVELEGVVLVTRLRRHPHLLLLLSSHQPSSLQLRSPQVLVRLTALLNMLLFVDFEVTVYSSDDSLRQRYLHLLF